MNIYDFIEAIVTKYGIRIYAWDIFCWRCKEETTLYTYDLIYDLRKAIRDFIPHNITIGTVPKLDEYLAQRYPTTHDNDGLANMCVHCRSAVPYNLSDEAGSAFCMSRAEESFWVDTIKIQDKPTIRAITDAIIAVYEDWRL